MVNEFWHVSVTMKSPSISGVLRAYNQPLSSPRYGGASYCNLLSGLHVRQAPQARNGRTQKARMRPEVRIQVCLERDVQAYSDESESLQ